MMLPDFVLVVFDEDNRRQQRYIGKEAKKNLSTGHYLCLKMREEPMFIVGSVRAVMAEDLSRFGIHSNGDSEKVLIQKVPATIDGCGTEVWRRIDPRNLKEIHQFERSRIRRGGNGQGD